MRAKVMLDDVRNNIKKRIEGLSEAALAAVFLNAVHRAQYINNAHAI